MVRVDTCWTCTDWVFDVGVCVCSPRLFAYSACLLLSVVFNLAHFVMWTMTMAGDKMNLNIFTKYRAEQIGEQGLTVGDWDSQLFLPLMVMFFFIEPMVSIVSYGMVLVHTSSTLYTTVNSRL